MKVWVERDKAGAGMIDMKTGESEYFWMDLLPRDFKKRFGFTPRKGSCKQYELTLKEIE